MLVSMLPFPSVQWHLDKLHMQHLFLALFILFLAEFFSIGLQFGLKARQNSPSAGFTQL